MNQPYNLYGRDLFFKQPLLVMRICVESGSTSVKVVALLILQNAKTDPKKPEFGHFGRFQLVKFFFTNNLQFTTGQCYIRVSCFFSLDNTVSTVFTCVIQNPIVSVLHCHLPFFLVMLKHK